MTGLILSVPQSHEALSSTVIMHYDVLRSLKASLGYDQPIMYAVIWVLWWDKSFELLALPLAVVICEEIQSIQLTNKDLSLISF